MGRKGKEVSVELRERIVQLSKEGISQRKIAEIVGRPRQTIQSIIKKFETTQMLANRPGRGRKEKLSAREQRAIVRKIKINSRITATALARELEADFGIKMHVTNVRKLIRKGGFRSRVARKKPWISAVNRRKRIEFAKKHLHEGQDFWYRVLFTDESKICVFNSSKRTIVWRRPGEAYEPKNLLPTVKHGGGSVLVWGAMAASGVGVLHFIDGIMDRFKYLDILKSQLHPSVEKTGLPRNYIFQQDNDPKHTARIVREWILYTVPQRLETPPQSPDVNPIEHVWAELKERVQKRNVSSVKELKSVLSTEWNNIPPDFTKKLVDSMPDRLAAIIKANGYPTRY